MSMPVSEEHNDIDLSAIEKIEDKEQDILQRIRTAGLRKPRETALIDNVLDLRKVRRCVLHFFDYSK